MDIKAEEISKIIREQIGSYAVDVDVAEELQGRGQPAGGAPDASGQGSDLAVFARQQREDAVGLAVVELPQDDSLVPIGTDR